MRGYERSGMTRQQYCAMNRVAVSTFAYHRKQWRQQQSERSSEQQLVRVHVARVEEPRERRATEGFTLKLAKARSIEAPWDFDGQELLRLIRIVEAA